MAGCLTDVAGITVGCWTDPGALTGCTVVLCPAGAVVAADVRGGAPGTRDTDLARPGMLVERAHAVLLTGGSAFGLDAAGGVMRWLEERGFGFGIGRAVVPIVPAAVVFDLAVGDGHVRPGAPEAYGACAAAGRDVPEGSVGAGTGCTVGKLFGLEGAMRGGQGTASRTVTGGYVAGALVVVNAVGDVVDPATGAVIAGARGPGGAFAGPALWWAPPEAARPASGEQGTVEAGPPALGDARDQVQVRLGRTAKGGAAAGPPALNTTIGVVATDAPLSKEQALRVAWMAHDGLARAIRPAHTLFDGVTIFVLALPPPGVAPLASGSDAARLETADGAAAADAVAEAVVRAVRAATSVPAIPAARDVTR